MSADDGVLTYLDVGHTEKQESKAKAADVAAESPPVSETAGGVPTDATLIFGTPGPDFTPPRVSGGVPSGGVTPLPQESAPESGATLVVDAVRETLAQGRGVVTVTESAPTASAPAAPSSPAPHPRKVSPPAPLSPRPLPPVAPTRGAGLNSGAGRERYPAIPVRTTPGPLLSLPIGSVLKERYQLEERIGAGGTSVVYRATDLLDLSPLAVKVMTIGAGDSEVSARFRRELELTGGFHHPNVLRVFGMGSERGVDFVTMELLTGGDLRSILGKPLPLATGLRIVTHAAAALEYIHERGVHHRDVKPANLFQTSRGIIKLMDFGFAKGEQSTAMTMAGTIIGTPDYISPEQVTGEHPVGAASDLYALGVVAYQLFTGELPFKHPQLMQLLTLHVRQKPRPPRELNPNIPQEVERAILRLMAKHPADRYLSAIDLRRDLGRMWALVGRQAAGG